ncbi:phage tail protein [Derxia gummosa]|uniref:Phage tail protein n=1 Tax=Derxia gummosa DSM 723 TaxID=1121388 RepID=A0A8B6X7U3_9BURK|nr:phage tail protein [Derxia gummosa]
MPIEPGTAPDPAYPIPAFHFSVRIDPGWPPGDNSFQEVSGIGPEMQVETVVEGGENQFVHTLPGGFKHPRLVLKRGISRADSQLTAWCDSILRGGIAGTIEPKTIELFLLGEDQQVLRGWNFVRAYPVKWTIDSFNAKNGSVAIENIEFCYQYSQRSS